MTRIPPTTLWNEAPTTCLEVNVEWRSHVIGLLGRALKSWYWSENQLEGEDGINEIINALATTECVEPVTYAVQRVIVKHELALNTAGGSTVAAALTRFPYNVLARDDTGEASLAANILTLPAGLWSIDAMHIIGAASATDVKGVLTGTGDIATANLRIPANGRIPLQLKDVIEIFVPTNIDFRYIIDVAAATNGLGFAMNESPYLENYGHIICERFHQLT